MVVCVSYYFGATVFKLSLKNLHYSYHLKTSDKPVGVPCNLPVKQQCYTPAMTLLALPKRESWIIFPGQPTFYCPFSETWSCLSPCKNLCAMGLQCVTLLSLSGEQLPRNWVGWVNLLTWKIRRHTNECPVCQPGFFAWSGEKETSMTMNICWNWAFLFLSLLKLETED